VTIDVDALIQGNRRALAKAITLIESQRSDDRDAAQHLLQALLPKTGSSIRLGITGIPGVGKSTFIEAFGLYLLSQGKRVAVLAVDPSSPISGGSILGDKTRMEVLSRHEGAFIRPSPSQGSLGGVAQKTRETMLLCEAAGYDVIIVETVGVGQSEYQVAAMVDFFMVLMLPNAGDELQGIKKGIMELADALVINKSDGDSVNLAKQTQSHYQSALHLLTPQSFWSPPVLQCSALKNIGIAEIWSMLLDFVNQAEQGGHFASKRQRQNREWMQSLIQELLQQKLQSNPDIRALMPELQRRVMAGEETPLLAAKTIIEML
jgi:LAO/AO transport system kinase